MHRSVHRSPVDATYEKIGILCISRANRRRRMGGRSVYYTGPIQRKALKELPHSGPAVQDLCDELARRLATFFQADCCFLTSTGFGSNILGFPAIASKDWMIVMDEKCHNSMFSGAFLSKAAARRRMKHNDTDDLEAILESTSKTFSNIMVAVEGMYR